MPLRTLADVRRLQCRLAVSPCRRERDTKVFSRACALEVGNRQTRCAAPPKTDLARGATRSLWPLRESRSSVKLARSGPAPLLPAERACAQNIDGGHARHHCKCVFAVAREGFEGCSAVVSAAISNASPSTRVTRPRSTGSRRPHSLACRAVASRAWERTPRRHAHARSRDP
jgi:hypothetical protein